MTRKAAAKSSEADAAVRRRSAGLDQRLRMSCSVAGFPNITRRRVLELLVSLASALRALRYSVLPLPQITRPQGLFRNLRWKIYAVQNSCSSQSLAWAAYTELKRFTQKSQLAACNMLAWLQHELQPLTVAFTARHLPFAPITASATRADGAARPWHPWLQPCWQC